MVDQAQRSLIAAVPTSRDPGVPLREALDSFFTSVCEPLTGEVTLRLYKGTLQPVSRKSPNSLYSLNIASFTMGASYDQKDALGFINLIGLPIKVRALLNNERI